MRYFWSAHRKDSKFWLIAGLTALVIFLATVIGLRAWYNHNLSPVSNTKTTQYFTVIPGDTLHEIAVNLARKKLIRSDRAFETYVRGKEFHDSLQAGTYSLSPSMSVQQIVNKMVEGDVAKNLLTILPAKNLKQIKETFKKQGYKDDEIEVAFQASQYRDHPVLQDLPAGATLEGYLYPDSFQKEVATPASTIIRQSLDEMQKHLTPAIKSGFKSHGLSEYQGITLASIVLQESDDPEVQPKIAQVYMTRLKQGMPLQADPTVFYASDLLGVKSSLSVDSEYNTYLHKGLPPGPIGNVSEDAMVAVANPAKSDYLFFVAGDDGVVHFSHTKEEHEAATKKYCHKLCQQ